jgi:hypothetical protein
MKSVSGAPQWTGRGRGGGGSAGHCKAGVVSGVARAERAQVQAARAYPDSIICCSMLVYPCRLRPLLSPPPPPAAAAAAASFGRRGRRVLPTPLAPRAGGPPLGRSIAIDLLLAPLVLVWRRLGLHMLPRKRKGRRPLEVMHEHRTVRRRPVRGAAPPLALPLRMACNVMHEGPDVDVVHRARRSRHHVPGARILKLLPLERLVLRTGGVGHPLGHLGRGCDVLEEGGGEEVARASAVGKRQHRAARVAALHIAGCAGRAETGAKVVEGRREVPPKSATVAAHAKLQSPRHNGGPVDGANEG